MGKSPGKGHPLPWRFFKKHRHPPKQLVFIAQNTIKPKPSKPIWPYVLTRHHPTHSGKTSLYHNGHEGHEGQRHCPSRASTTSRCTVLGHARFRETGRWPQWKEIISRKKGKPTTKTNTPIHKVITQNPLQNRPINLCRPMLFPGSTPDSPLFSTPSTIFYVPLPSSSV